MAVVDSIVFAVQGDPANVYVSEVAAIDAASAKVADGGKALDILKIVTKVTGTVSPATPVFVRAVA